MKFKTKLKLTAATVAGTAIGGAILSRSLDGTARKLLSRESVTRASIAAPSSGSLRDRASNTPEFILGQLFRATATQIDLTIPSFDGTQMNAILYDAEGSSDMYAIVLHGYGSSPRACAHIARRYREAGYNVLVPYMRAHFGSDADFCTMGQLERLDALEWIKYISGRSQDARIVLHGISMGAATVMLTTGEELPRSVVCAVEDCGYTSAYDVYAHIISSKMHLPRFPTLSLITHAVKRRAGFDLREVSALAAVRRSITPTLFVHGSSDTTVPVEMARELYANAACERELIVFPDTEHGLSSLLHPEKYWNAVFNFIKKHSK